MMEIISAGPCGCECASCDIGAHCRDIRHGCEIDDPEVTHKRQEDYDKQVQQELATEIARLFQ